MATTSFTIDGVKGRTSSNRRFVVVDVRHDLDKVDILFRTDNVAKAVARQERERGSFIVDTAGAVKVRRPGTRVWEDAVLHRPGLTKLCNICRVNRVPVGVHACEVCD